MKYYVLSEAYDESSAFVDDIPDSVQKVYELLEGVSRADGWPSEASFPFSSDRPEGINVNDFIGNSRGLLLVSDRFKTLLEAERSARLEFLPIQLADHKKRPVKGKYWIANFLELTEVVDRKASKFTISPADENAIRKFDKLVLKKQIADSGPAILRMKEKYMLLLVGESLVAKIQAAGLTGMELADTQSYKTYPGTR